MRLLITVLRPLRAPVVYSRAHYVVGPDCIPDARPRSTPLPPQSSHHTHSTPPTLPSPSVVQVIVSSSDLHFDNGTKIRRANQAFSSLPYMAFMRALRLFVDEAGGCDQGPHLHVLAKRGLGLGGRSRVGDRPIYLLSLTSLRRRAFTISDNSDQASMISARSSGNPYSSGTLLECNNVCWFCEGGCWCDHTLRTNAEQIPTDFADTHAS